MKYYLNQTVDKIMKKVLENNFFDRPAVEVAKDLVGKYLVRRIRDKEISLLITETEAYDGPEDKACHGRFGLTKRNAVMFGPAGRFYVYLIYGMHWMLNVITGPEGYPAGVLIRGAGEITGPARLTKYLKITKKLYNKPAEPKTGLWFEDRGILVPKHMILTTPRIGVDYAGPLWSKKLYRFVLQKNKGNNKFSPRKTGEER